MIKTSNPFLKTQKNLTALAILGTSALLNLNPFSAAQAAILPSFTLNPSPPAGSNLLNPGANYVLGYNFKIDLEAKLNSVGIFVPTTTSHTIGIWDASNYSDANPVLGPLVWQKQINDTNSCQTISSYCWFSMSDGPKLMANYNYVVAATWGSENVPYKLDSNTLTVNPGNGSTIPTIGIGQVANSQEVFSGLIVDFNDPLISPTYTPNDSDVTSGVGFLSVNLSFDGSTPTQQIPAPLPLFGAAAAFGFSRKIRRRISISS